MGEFLGPVPKLSLAGQQIGADVREQLVPVDLRFFDLHALQRIEIIGDHKPLVAADAALVSQWTPTP